MHDIGIFQTASKLSIGGLKNPLLETSLILFVFRTTVNFWAKGSDNEFEY